MKHSQKAWEMATPIYGAIIQHPFNQEMMKGTLDSEKFIYYMEQDSLFLNDLSSCFALIASKIQPEYASAFLQLAHETKAAAQGITKRYCTPEQPGKHNRRLSRATLSFTSYLLRMAAVEPVELAVAAILPCFWVYHECMLLIAKNAAANNPYLPWIQQISSKEFGAQVNSVIAIFDALAEKTTDDNRQKMLEAFSKCTMLEWHFWNDVYEAIVFEPV